MRVFVYFLLANLLVCNLGYCDEFDTLYREELRKDGYIHISEVTTDSLINGLSDKAVPDLSPKLSEKDPVTVTINNNAHTTEHSTAKDESTNLSPLWFVIGLLAGGAGGYLAVKHWR